jgi:lysophospholipase L1-like esterase
MRIFFLLIFFASCADGQVLTGTQQFISADQIPGLITNWDLNDANEVTQSGGLLVQLNDKGSGNNDVIPASEGVRPAYFATGGPNNRGYVEIASGKTFQNTTLSLTTSPFTLFAVVKLPSLATTNGQSLLNFGNTGGTDAIEYNTAQGGFFRVYTGVSPFFSASHTLPNRTDWMLIKLTVKDANSFWVEVNDEPIGAILNTTYGTPSTVLNRIAFSFPGIKIASVRLYNRLLSPVEDQGIKTQLVSDFALVSPAKLIVLLGDSHTEGVMSGTQTLGPYGYRLVAAYPGQIVNHAKSGTCVDPGTYGQGFDAANQVYNNLKDRYPLYSLAKYANVYVVFQYGTNDSAIRGTGAVGAPNRSQWNTLYRQYIQAFIDAGFPLNHLVICTPPYSTGSYVSTTLSEFNSDVQTIASEKGILLCDFYGAMVTAGLNCGTTPDAIHGDDAIHTVLYNTFEETLHP